MLEKFTRFETSDKTSPATNYYRNTYNQVKEAVIVTAKKMGYEVKAQNDDHREFLLKKGGIEIVVTCFNITIMETAVDLTVMSGLFNPGKKIAATFYDTMKTQLTLK